MRLLDLIRDLFH